MCKATGQNDDICKAIGKNGQKFKAMGQNGGECKACLLYTSPSPRDISGSRMPSSA